MMARTLQTFLASAALAVVAAATVFQFLTLDAVPNSPNQDLAKHVASILNFQSAFLDGQWIPRLQLRPSTLPDLPVFQYYSSLLGYLSLPFLTIGLKPIVAITTAILLARWLGALAIYEIGRVCEATQIASLTAAISYLLTPYIISNIYGRVAFPEGTAHGILPILFFGLIRLQRSPDWLAACSIIFSFVGLALAHPIFLLYGIAAASFFIVIAFPFRAAFGAAIILLGGVLLASFQWLPPFVTQSHLSLDFSQFSPFYFRRFTSYRGLYSTPLSLVEEGIWFDGDKLFLTPSILTIPVLALLVLRCYGRLSFAILMSALGFLLLSYAPLDFWRYLPKFTWAVQFPYRLLAFVAMFVAIGLIIIAPKMRWQVSAIIIGLLVWQNHRLLTERTYNEPIALKPAEIAETYANGLYAYFPRESLLRLDGVVRSYATSVPLVFTVDEKGFLKRDNFILAATPFVNQSYIRVRGANISDLPVSLWLAPEKNRDAPIDGARLLLPGEKFSVIFTIPASTPTLSINLSDINFDKKVLILSIDQIPGNQIPVSAATDELRSLDLSGTTIPEDKPVLVWLAKPASSETPIVPKALVGPGTFHLKFDLPPEAASYMLMTSSPASNDDTAGRTIRLFNYAIVNQSNGARVNFLPEIAAERVSLRGYRRTYRVPSGVVSNFDTRPFTIELPIAYSPFMEISQGEQTLASMPDYRGLIVVIAKKLDEPFFARYHLPWLIWPATFIGAFLPIIGLIWLRARRFLPRRRAFSRDTF